MAVSQNGQPALTPTVADILSYSQHHIEPITLFSAPNETVQTVTFYANIDPKDITEQ